MRLNVYTIFDQAAAVYKRPFVAQADGEVLRVFKDMALNKDHEIGAHPEDYTLWRIGTFDDNKAELVAEAKECLATALELVSSARSAEEVRENMEKLEVNSPGGTV
jgi:hypothetical protein